MTKTLLLAGLAASLFATAAGAQDMKSVAISTIVEVPALTETRDGVIEGLAANGFIEGETITIDYQNANGNMPTQQQIAKKFAGDRPDVIVSITTPTSQAMISTVPKDIPIVFATVTDPIKAKLIDKWEKPGGNITGISDAAPIKQQVELMREVLPDLKTLGFVYNPGLDNAVSTLEKLRAEVEPMGIEVVESPSPTANEIIPATRSLVGKVDAIYIPNDTTVVAALESIVKIGQDTDTPIFAGETGAVGRGVIASVGLDYIGIGKVAGEMAARVLNGENPGEIDSVLGYEMLSDFKVVVNPPSAAAMGVELPDTLMQRATEVIE
ncbi:MAG: ABC transporter substrate-binding protein [Acuticoccus sp.]